MTSYNKNRSLKWYELGPEELDVPVSLPESYNFQSFQRPKDNFNSNKNVPYKTNLANPSKIENDFDNHDKHKDGFNLNKNMLYKTTPVIPQKIEDDFQNHEKLKDNLNLNFNMLFKTNADIPPESIEYKRFLVDEKKSFFKRNKKTIFTGCIFIWMLFLTIIVITFAIFKQVSITTFSFNNFFNFNNSIENLVSKENNLTLTTIFHLISNSTTNELISNPRELSSNAEEATVKDIHSFSNEQTIFPLTTANTLTTFTSTISFSTTISTSTTTTFFSMCGHKGSSHYCH